MGQTRGERLKLARERHFRSGRAAASALGIPPATYGAHERAEMPGGRDYGPDEAKIYARRFRVSPEYLLTGNDPRAGFEVEAPEEQARPRTVKLKGYVGAGGAAHFYALSQGDMDDVPAPDNASDTTVAVEIKGDSLGEMLRGWLAFYDEVRRPVTPDLVGHLCVVGLPDDRVLIKKIRPGTRRGYFHLLSERGDPIEDTRVDWAAKVLDLRPKW